jgi:pyruvyltransferase
MAPFLLQAATGQMPIWVPSWYEGKILSTGSLIHRIQAGDVVWGTGAIKGLPVEVPATARVLAVRGPLTRRLLGAAAPEVYGDPALLLPRFYDEPQVVTYEVGVVPHYLDKRYMRSPPDPAILTIDVQADWRIVVDNIRRCRSILSSSLHGLIVAEAFGIPATWVSAGDRLPGGEFKFHDYYLATGREPPAALPWDGRPPHHWRVPPRPRIDLEPLLVAAKGVVDQGAGP